MSKIDKIYVKIYNSHFFQKYGFADIDGEYWETEKKRDHFNEGEEYEIPWVDKDLMPAVKPMDMGQVICITQEEAKLKRWGIEHLLLEEFYPEYYI